MQIGFSFIANSRNASVLFNCNYLLSTFIECTFDLAPTPAASKLDAPYILALCRCYTF